MTWQEELRQLDSALAGGELSANEYRKRRDEILAAASSAQPPSPVIGPPTGPRPVITPGAATPPPPEVPAPDAAEVTQVVNVESAAEPAGEVTQIIANPIKGNNGAQATPAPREEPTSPAIPQPQWASLPPSHNAQTSVSSIPPIPPPPPQVTGPAVTPLDAQDLFTSNKAPSGSRNPVLIGLAVLVALAVVGAGVWFFVFSGDDSPETAADTNQTSNEQPTTQALPEPVDITKIELPGELAANSGEMDITRASEMAVIAPAEATLLADAGAQQLTYLGHSEGNYRFLLYAYKSDGADGAKELTTRINGVQQQLGFTATEVNGVPGTVAVTTFSNPEAVALRGVYTYGDTTIQLSVLQVPVGDLAELHAQFQTAMTAVTDAAPPTE